MYIYYNRYSHNIYIIFFRTGPSKSLNPGLRIQHIMRTARVGKQLQLYRSASRVKGTCLNVGQPTTKPVAGG